MPKYEVLIARTETAIYTIGVEAANTDEAEESAYQKFAENDYIHKEIVFGMEETDDIFEIDGDQNA